MLFGCVEYSLLIVVRDVLGSTMLNPILVVFYGPLLRCFKEVYTELELLEVYTELESPKTASDVMYLLSSMNKNSSESRFSIRCLWIAILMMIFCDSDESQSKV